MESAFGVEHGGEISKAKEASRGRKVAGSTLGTYHAAVAGRKGKKLRAVGNATAGGLGGGFAGSTLGAMGGALATRGKSTKAMNAGMMGGSVAGTLGGGLAAVNRNQRKGYYKPEKKR